MLFSGYQCKIPKGTAVVKLVRLSNKRGRTWISHQIKSDESLKDGNMLTSIKEGNMLTSRWPYLSKLRKIWGLVINNVKDLNTQIKVSRVPLWIGHIIIHYTLVLKFNHQRKRKNQTFRENQFFYVFGVYIYSDHFLKTSVTTNCSWKTYSWI